MPQDKMNTPSKEEMKGRTSMTSKLVPHTSKMLLNKIWNKGKTKYYYDDYI